MAAIPPDLPPAYLGTGYRRIMNYLGEQLKGRLVLRFASPFRVTDVPRSTTSPPHTLVEFGAVPTVWTNVDTQSSGYTADYGELVPVNAVGGEVIVTLPLVTADDVGRRICVTADPAPSGNPVKARGTDGQTIHTQIGPDFELGTFFQSVVVVAQFEADVGYWGVESTAIVP